METITRLCGLALREETQWPLDAFTDDPVLNIIDPDLRQTIMSGKVDIPGFCPTICFCDAERGGIFTVRCSSGYDSATRKSKQVQFTWNVNQVKKFLDYIEGKGIGPC